MFPDYAEMMASLIKTVPKRKTVSLHDLYDRPSVHPDLMAVLITSLLYRNRNSRENFSDVTMYLTLLRYSLPKDEKVSSLGDNVVLLSHADESFLSFSPGFEHWFLPSRSVHGLTDNEARFYLRLALSNAPWWYTAFILMCHVRYLRLKQPWLTKGFVPSRMSVSTSRLPYLVALEPRLWAKSLDSYAAEFSVVENFLKRELGIGISVENLFDAGVPDSVPVLCPFEDMSSMIGTSSVSGSYVLGEQNSLFFGQKSDNARFDSWMSFLSSPSWNRFLLDSAGEKEASSITLTPMRMSWEFS
jgi:hypothetical protein